MKQFNVQEALGQYQQAQYNQLSRGRILLALYHTTAQHLLDMHEAITNRDIPRKGILFGKISAILSLLQRTLKDEVAPELVEKLRALYLYFSERLFEASIHLKPEPVEEVRKLWDTLLHAWEKAVEQTEQEDAHSATL